MEGNNINEKSRIFSYNTLVQITVVGKGMIVGEEVLTSGDEYSYNVKVEYFLRESLMIKYRRYQIR